MDKIMMEYGITPFPKETSEAMAYIPFQPNNAATYGAMQGFENGTMFPSLNKPFFGSKCTGVVNDKMELGEENV